MKQNFTVETLATDIEPEFSESLHTSMFREAWDELVKKNVIIYGESQETDNNDYQLYIKYGNLKPERISGDVSKIAAIYEEKRHPRIYFVKFNDDQNELCRYSDGKVSVIAKNISNIADDISIAFILNKGRILLGRDMHLEVSEPNAVKYYTFDLLENGKITHLANEVVSLRYAEPNQILFLSDDVLYSWNRNKKNVLADDVKAFWLPNSKFSDCHIGINDWSN